MLTPLFLHRPLSGNRSRDPAMFSQYLMNDIPRGTKYSKIMNSLLAPPYGPGSEPPEKPRPQVVCSLVITDSRLDDELSVATIEFSDTPRWLRDLNNDPHGFPKKTPFGTLWSLRGINVSDVDEHTGQTEFIRAIIKGGTGWNFFYAEMLAEFQHIDVNVQDKQGRTALHWASHGGQSPLVNLCLSVPDCDIGLKDHDGLTAFDISLQSGNETVPNLFYTSMFEMDEKDPQAALLRLLTVSSVPAEDLPEFPGKAIFDPIIDRNTPLVVALINRGVDLTARDQDGNTALHLAAVQVDNAEIAMLLLNAGADINARDGGGATPLDRAKGTADMEMVQLLLNHKPDIVIKNINENSEFPSLRQNKRRDVSPLAKDSEPHTEEISHGEQTAQQIDPDGSMPLDSSAAETLPVETSEAEDPKIAQPKLSHLELKTANGLTALLQAVHDGDQDVVELLLSLGADIEALDSAERTSLQLAATAGHTEILKSLLAAGAGIKIPDDKTAALRVASDSGYTAIVDLLLAAGADTEGGEDGHKKALQLASGRGHKEIVKSLLAAGANTEGGDDEWESALEIASMRGYTEIVEELLAAGADIERGKDQWDTALQLASDKGHAEIVKKLLAAGADPEMRKGRFAKPLQSASHNGHAEVVEILLAAGADIEGGKDHLGTALQLASGRGHMEVVRRLLVAGADTEGGSDNKETALQLASGGRDNWGAALPIVSVRGCTEIVDELLVAGANIEGRKGTLATPLQSASETGYTEIFEKLLAAGADPEGRKGTLATPLQYASKNGHTEVVEKLLAAGADTEGGKDGLEKPLQLAAGRGHKEVVRRLLAGGANTEGGKDHGDTALQLASKKGHTEIVVMLKTAGARSTTARLRYTVGRQLRWKDTPRANTLRNDN